MEGDGLIRECVARGDVQGAADALVRAHGARILRFIGSSLERDDANDVFAQWCEDVLRGLPGFRGECAARTWAFRLAQTAVSRFRRDPYRARCDRLPSSGASRLAASVDGSVLEDSRRDRLRRLREELHEEDRTLLVLRVDNELEWEEIAAVLAQGGAPVSAATLRKRYERLVARIERRARELHMLE